ncbi:MAG TPA: tRNA pseudouridine(38-40) synthase TruA [Candidatus Polarisedimenticolaceae bacterium]|nr:tRNA pseudouridine(38-40) synthase TruA [Candidatus Polarisedimenticolaceae bacterium]
MTRAARRIRLDLAYDGTGYAGWQVQPNRPTIQGTVEEALARLHGGTRVNVRGAGRTDAGVHARGQVADATVALAEDDTAIAHALRRILPDAIRVQDVATVPDGFHSRHDAIAKTYAYYVDRSPAGDPFLARYALHATRRLDLDAIDAALTLLPGRRDFTGFAAASCVVADRVRTMTVARRVAIRPSLDALAFTADGFLTHMVRNIVGTLLEIGAGRFDPQRIAEVLASGERRLAGPTAAARALTLERVDYGVTMRAR